MQRRFAVREGDALVSGSVDRLVIWQSADGQVLAADVIDFKTDRAGDAGQLDERVEIYRPQMLAYRRAVERAYWLEPEQVASRLVFLQPGVIRPARKARFAGDRGKYSPEGEPSQRPVG